MASSYGKGKYGSQLYSWSPTVDFGGNLTPTISFSGTIDVLVAQGDLVGNLRPVIVLGGSLVVDRVFAGDMAPRIVLAASGQFGPYWPPSELCPPSIWTPTGPCEPVDWEKVNG